MKPLSQTSLCGYQDLISGLPCGEYLHHSTKAVLTFLEPDLYQIPLILVYYGSLEKKNIREHHRIDTKKLEKGSLYFLSHKPPKMQLL